MAKTKAKQQSSDEKLATNESFGSTEDALNKLVHKTTPIGKNQPQHRAGYADDFVGVSLTPTEEYNFSNSK